MFVQKIVNDPTYRTKPVSRMVYDATLEKVTQ